MPPRSANDFVVGVVGDRIPRRDLFGRNAFFTPGALDIIFGAGDGNGSRSQQKQKKGPRKWAMAPGWAQSATGGKKETEQRDDPGSFAPGGTFFVGIGGSRLPRRGLFGCNVFFEPGALDILFG